MAKHWTSSYLLTIKFLKIAEHLGVWKPAKTLMVTMVPVHFMGNYKLPF